MAKSKKGTSKKGTKKRKAIPMAILNELKIGLALRGYSTMAQKDKMSIREQWLFLERFYHGKGNTHPSQCDLLVRGVGVYADLWDQKVPTVVDKNHQGVGYQLVLKRKYIPDCKTDYIAGVDILLSELEKKTRSNKQLVTGRNLLDIANRNITKHRKAIAFASHLWDLDTNTPIDSGTKEADCIEYVRCKMWHYLKKKQERKKENGGSDSSENEEEDQEEDELLTELQASVDNGDDNTSEGFVEEQLPNEDPPMPALENATEVEIVEEVDDVPPLTTREANELAANGDEDFQLEEEEVIASEGEEVITAEVEQEDEVVEATVVDNTVNLLKQIDRSLIPDHWHFPGFLAFVAWGPFCAPVDRLRTVLVTGLSRKDVQSRNQMRKADKEMKAKMRLDDGENKRGYTTDQMISMEAVSLQKDRLNTQKQEVAIAGLGMRNSILDAQINRYERMAERKCPVYDPLDPSWIKVNELLEQQSAIMNSIDKLTNSITPSTDNVNTEKNENTVIDLSSNDNRVGKEVTCVSEEINSTMTTTTSKDILTPSKPSSTSKSATTTSSTKANKVTSTNTTPVDSKDNTMQSSSSTTFCRPLPSKVTKDKGKFQFDGNPIWFCAAGMKHCLAPHVEVGKLCIHSCHVCKEKVHSFCISVNDEGKMLCAGCDRAHGYKDAIPVSHKMDAKWKKDLVDYYQARDGIPKGISFLATEEYMQSQKAKKNISKRSSRNSNKNDIPQPAKKLKKTPQKRTRSSNRKRIVS